MVYNPPPDGHVLMILDNGTTAMTGQQEHPGTGRDLLHKPSARILFEDIARAMGIDYVVTIDPMASDSALEQAIRDALDSGRIAVIVARRPCILAAPKIRQYERNALQVKTVCANACTVE